MPKKAYDSRPAVHTNWFVITGAPSSGKTKVIEHLAQRGYRVQHEVGYEVISIPVMPVEQRTAAVLRHDE